MRGRRRARRRSRWRWAGKRVLFAGCDLLGELGAKGLANHDVSVLDLIAEGSGSETRIANEEFRTHADDAIVRKRILEREPLNEGRMSTILICSFLGSYL
jgi:hypothetical protein